MEGKTKKREATVVATPPASVPDPATGSDVAGELASNRAELAALRESLGHRSEPPG